jgi:hypothetical protein
VKLLRASAAFAAVAVLVACGSPSPTPTSTETPGTQACSDSATEIVSAVGELVAGYEQPGASTGDESTADRLSDAVAAARQTRDEFGCDSAAFTAQLEDGLAGLEPTTPIAAAVWRRLSASILGKVRQDAGDWVLGVGDDLQDVVARAAEGTTVVLPKGTVELDGTLVLLEGVTIRGSGRDATTIRSTASDAGMIIATASLIRVEDLTLEMGGDQPASGLVAGPSASVALTDVRITGATAGEDGAGGAGVYLSAEGDQGSGRGTTLEITDSAFEHNAWAGIAVAGGHRVSIQSATFTGNGDVGIIFLDTASGSVDASTFTDNTVGLAATGTANPTWLGSTVTGGSVGAQVDGSATPVIDGLHISGSSSAAVIFGAQSAGSIGGTTCESVPYGILIADTAAPTLGENSCTVARGAP